MSNRGRIVATVTCILPVVMLVQVPVPRQLEPFAPPPRPVESAPVFREAFIELMETDSLAELIKRYRDGQRSDLEMYVLRSLLPHQP